MKCLNKKVTKTKRILQAQKDREAKDKKLTEEKAERERKFQSCKNYFKAISSMGAPYNPYHEFIEEET